MFGLPLTFDQITQGVITIGGIVFAVGYGYKQLTSGGKKADTDLISTLTQQIDAQKAINQSQQDQFKHQREELHVQLHNQQEQINKLTLEIGKLQGEKTANDQKIKEYLQLIANRNPELEDTLKALESLIRDVVPFMEEVKVWHHAIQADHLAIKKALGLSGSTAIKHQKTTTKKTTEVIT